MQIKIYGADGCMNCTELKEKAEEVVEENGFDAEVSKVTDMGKLAEKGIMSTPAFEVGDDMVFQGSNPPKDHVEELIEERL